MKPNKIKPNGLRYEFKESITPFFGGDSVSCVKCSVFKLRKLGNFYNRFGGRLFICFECKPKKNTEKVKVSNL